MGFNSFNPIRNVGGLLVVMLFVVAQLLLLGLLKIGVMAVKQSGPVTMEGGKDEEQN